ncbi:hypothetical protein GB928_000845 [Shinella curvata]|uniref:Uncharacterized protein n=1 Tax=Shinella curvata TaxID=1817964 RepID=A0ABT8X8R7_9HYPH|nr:hypothetical protein [Shinella curvata]MCJ8052330.1 hypothetical protein [Shinella curvata]MDO6119721.1 hypothetical protein [Shinella curvata]
MQPNSVTLSSDNDDWIVVVVEDGEELHRSFKIQSHAQNWSDGQRIRLGLYSGSADTLSLSDD